ncbi:unnamed protein product [Anisakis simplex]|uniref:RING-type E3 ubiquitin transferase n=1 Tax=Anisakis simplex TaxID=6269 RepID=A0A0M3KAI9_ANISI|nr:unnamed protein product [Anisakis simplex]
MQTYVAEISEILRAEKRDDEHLARLEANFSKLLKDLVGVHSWIRFYRYIPVFVKTLYYACTTLSGVQTLGEEYLALLQVSSSGGKVAVSSLYKRFVFVFLNIFAPILLEILLRKLDQHINQIDTNKFFGVPLRGNQKARQTFTKIFDWIRLKGIPSAYRLHIAIFYLYGSYYSLSKRFSGISYLSLRPQTNLQASRLLKFIAYLTVLQFSIAVVSWIYENFFCQLLEHDKRVDIDSENDSELIELGESEQSTSELTRFSCGICQSTHYPSCLPCGHLYCWYCIIQHAHECSLIQERQPYCPHCRSSFEASRVVPLLNF